MVAPVTGPFTTTVTEPTGSSTNLTYYSWQRGYKQAKPLDRPLAYERKVGAEITRISPGYTEWGSETYGSYDHILLYDHWFQPVIGRCYDAFKDALSDRAQMGVAVAELNQSIAMVNNRVTQLAKFTREVRRLDFQSAARTLRMSTVPKGVSIKKSFANNWLEYWFGWSAAISDIHSAIDVLQSPIKTHIVKVGRSEKGIKNNLSIPVDEKNPSAWYPNYTEYKSYRHLYGSVSVKMGAEVAVDNPNLWLANQLGLVNPATIAFELIPFSFVVDWLINVEQFLSQGTDFVGLTLKNEWTTECAKGLFLYYEYYRYRWSEGSTVVYGGLSVPRYVVGRYAHTKRSLGIQRPQLFIRPLRLWRWQRAASATSLLVQQLERGRR